MTQKLAISLSSHDEINSFMLQALISLASFIPGSASALFLKMVHSLLIYHVCKQLTWNRGKESEIVGMTSWLE